jgi:hypothetical protein
MGDLKVVFAPTAVARERTAQATVTFVSNPATGATSAQTIQLPRPPFKQVERSR